MNQKVVKLLNDQGGNYIFPFFWQHGENEEVLRTYMKIINESNIKAVCIESRPHPDFCGPKWWRDMDIIMDEARVRGMKVWILDDSHFPTGYANGAMEGQPEELFRQSICCATYHTEAGKLFCLEKEQLEHPKAFEKSMIEQFVLKDDFPLFSDDRLLAVYAVRVVDGKPDFVHPESQINLFGNIGKGSLEWRCSEGEWKIYVMHLSRNFGYHRSYINMLSKVSCRVLIKAVYEKHYERYKNDFGRTIEGFFSDEPELGNGHMYEIENGFGTDTDFPWSQELEECLEKEMGADYVKMLPLLCETEAKDNITAKARYQYMNAVTNLVKRDFSEQIGDWCREHNVKYIGHMIEDNNHHSRTGSSLGHYFRGLAGQDMSGIDDIGGQVYPQGEDIETKGDALQTRSGGFYHYTLGKLASSAAAIEPLKNGNSMCEIFGNYGWSEGVRLEKYLADHFMVRGINHYVPHAFSPKPFPDPDCPPHFYAHGNNPQYRHFGYLMKYMNRICELISDGRHIANVALIYDGEGDWTGKYQKDDIVGRQLYDAQIDYDIIPQDVFIKPEVYKLQINHGVLKVNTQEYKAVVSPYMQFITAAFAEYIEKLDENGVKVFFINALPKGICDAKESESETLLAKIKKHAKSIPLEQLVLKLRGQGFHEIQLIPGNNRIRYLHYIHGDQTELFYFINEGAKSYHGSVLLPWVDRTNARTYRYDAWNNRIERVELEENKLRLSLESLKSFILVLDCSMTDEEAEKYPLFMEQDFTGKQELFFDGQWSRGICESLEYPAFKEKKQITLPDCLEVEQPSFSGFISYENRFSAKKGERIFLEISDAYEGVEVFLNNKSMGVQIVPTYCFELSDYVLDGENHLRIEVATTLERATSDIPDMLGRKKQPESYSGIKGTVRLYKL